MSGKKASAYCQSCGVKFEYDLDAGSDYYHGISETCPNGHGVCCLPDRVDLLANNAVPSKGGQE